MARWLSISEVLTAISDCETQTTLSSIVCNGHLNKYSTRAGDLMAVLQQRRILKTESHLCMRLAESQMYPGLTACECDSSRRGD